MELNKYLINRQYEIILLKYNLMEIAEDTKASTQNKDKNFPNVGIIFEENVRETLIKEYNFGESEFPRDVIFREIGNEDKTISKTILSVKNEIVRINGDYLTLQLKRDFSISIYKEDKLLKKIKDSQYIIEESINDQVISFLHHGEVEVDDILVCENNFKISMFLNNEVLKVYSNINEKEEEEKTFQVMILEIKLKAEHLIDLIIQMRRDEKFFSRLIREKIVYVGFVGSGKIDYKINFKELLGGMKCVRYIFNST